MNTIVKGGRGERTGTKKDGTNVKPIAKWQTK